MHVNGESDESKVPATLANKDDAESAVSIEDIGSANGNADQTALHLTPRRLPTRQRNTKWPTSQ